MVNRINSKSSSVPAVISTIEGLQCRFVKNLESMASSLAESRPFVSVEWFRDGGQHGGGLRYEAPTGPVFNAGSVNFSHVQYDDDSTKPLRSATALSTIIHPRSPFAPSIHIHLSWTELKSGRGYWRIMADLNPSIPNDEFRERFLEVLKSNSGEHFKKALSEGEKYFYIPTLKRHRGVAHFYLEEFSCGDFKQDLNFCETLIKAVMDLYPTFISKAVHTRPDSSPSDLKSQLDYHTLYFLQVLTLDRGTTAGLLVHDQNDLGTLGSLPSHVDKTLLEYWLSKHQAELRDLLQSLIDALPQGNATVQLGPDLKLKLVAAMRQFYKQNPNSLNLQATGTVTPKTIANHD